MRDVRFTFLLTKEERRALAVLAVHLRRSQGDTVRWLVHEAVDRARDQRAAAGDTTEPAA